ncbi:MBL fold metallo-hydrolase [Sporocytophaga myxococcoides]|uniref:MBL fold metallo-hydrolase n=1 Tax=Sporocytophaga myxococcoides TaxID=153721 RepID=UPI00040D7C57|nr:MBL fold metallo-hydrolase [Sporocytophaga myxococcoides]
MNAVIPISIWPKGLINCFLIKGDHKHVLVDTGVPGSEHRIFRQLEEHNIDKADIGLIIITHGHIDHFGSAAQLKKLLNVPILAHQSDLEAYTSGKADITTLKPNNPQWKLFKAMIKDQRARAFQPDILMKDDTDFSISNWGIRGKVIHTPGHTPGSISIILDNGEAIIMDMLATGILLGGIMLNSRIKHPPFHDDLRQLKSSFEKVISENGSRYYLGHGGPVSRELVIKYYNKYIDKKYR